MSKLVPTEVAEVRRLNTDVLVGYMGLDCWLYKITSTTLDKLRSDPTFVFAAPIRTQVQIIWTPDIRMLKSLGLYTEEKAPLPILSYWKFADDPSKYELFELDYEFAVGDTKTNRFQIVDRRILGHGIETITVWLVAPARRWPIP